MGYGPVASDVAKLIGLFGDPVRKEHGDSVMKIYHDKLTEMGKIDTSVFTLEKLKSDVSKYYMPANVLSTTKMNF